MMRYANSFARMALWCGLLLVPAIADVQVTRADYERAAGLRRKYEGLAVNIVDRRCSPPGLRTFDGGRQPVRNQRASLVRQRSPARAAAHTTKPSWQKNSRTSSFLSLIF